MANKKIKVSGPIISNEDAWVYDYFGIENCSPRSIERQLANIPENEEFEVEINSGGGEIFAGSEIYTMLSSRKNKLTINIVGLAASAASVVAMAGTCYMSPTAMMMVHNVSGGCNGDNRDMEHMSEVLQKANKAMASAYVAKSGMKESDVLEMMNHETWLTAEQAKEKNLVDGIMFEASTLRLSASYNSGLIPYEVIEKMKNERQNEVLEDKVKAEKRFKNLGGQL